MVQSKIIDQDIYHSASTLVREHGNEAPIFAAMQADAVLDAGDLDSYATWRRILAAVEELCRNNLADGEPMH